MKVAIVGAGISGLSAASFLLSYDPRLEIVVFERQAHVGGRMATKLVPLSEVTADTGCQFLSIDQPEILDFFLENAPTNAVRELPQTLLCLPDGFVIDARGRYYLEGGLAGFCQNLVKRLQKASAAPSENFHLVLNAEIEDLKSLWRQGFERVLISAPGPEARALGAQKAVDYQPCLTLLFSWHRPPRSALQHYAFRDISSREGLAWLSHEGTKSGKPGLWLAQVSPKASVEWAELPHDRLEDLIQEDLTAWIPAFAAGEKTLIDRIYWPRAFPVNFGEPSEEAPFERIDQTEPSGANKRIYFFGDGYRGVGRAENAIESALAVARDFFSP